MNAEQLNFPEPTVAPPPSSNASEGDASNSASAGAPGKSRRRRRKRKNRTGAANGEAGNSPQANASSEGGEVAAPAQNANQQPRQNNNGQQQGQGQGTKRWKKKKGGRSGGGDGHPRPEPGNSLQGSNSGMGNRGRGRKQQPRGPRAFVGPMDHSYREVNGNFADTPASTIEIHGNHRGRQNNHRNHFNEDRLPPELMHHQRAVAIPEDAPTHIYFFIEDLFFTAKIQEAARLQGVKVAFVKPEKDIVAHLAELPEHEHPSLIVFDLNNANAKPLTLIPKLKNKLKKGTSIIGFLSHLQGDLKAKAVEAGCHSVMPRAAFSQNLPNLLRRYGVEDEHEPNYNM
ncbi:MAG: response regulator [Terriglobus sp.]